MRSYLALLIVALALIAGGCAVKAAFDPVEGPAAQQVPPPVYMARASGILSGAPSVTLANGERFTGNWRLHGREAAAANPADARDALSADWDLVYGPGYYRAHVLGTQLFVRAHLTGDAGSSAIAELANETNQRGHTRGVARDSHGNLYKVTVYN